MPVSVARKGVWAIVLVGILLILAIAALPLVASTQIVRDSIAHQMSLWSGYRVRLDDKPQIRVWPSFQAVLNDVTFLDWNNTNPHTVIEAEQIEMDLSALAALRGEVVFTRMRLVRPILRLGQDGETLHLPAPQNWGRLARSVNTARQAIAAAPNQPDTTALPGDAFGVVKFVEGRVVAGTDDQQVDIVTSLSGTLDWPALNRQAALTATGIWHGESVSLTALSAEPLILLGGGNAAVDIALQAAPANLTFKGKASLLDTNFVDGYLNLSAPSLRRLVEWTHARPIVTNRVGPVSLSSRLVGDPRRLKFEETTLTLDNSTGKGLLDLSLIHK
jgi:AsmA protein